MLSYIDLVIECRDYRVPLVSRNPLFEEGLGGRERLIVYTKQDLGSEGKLQDRNVCLMSEFKKRRAQLIASAERVFDQAMAKALLGSLLRPQE